MGWNYDPDGIHAHQSGEINALTEKTTPHADDLLLGEDSENSGAKVGIKVGNLGGGAEVLDDLTDVDTTGVADGDVLVYDADTSTWVPGEGGGGSANASYSEKVGDTSETTFNIEHSLDSSAVVVEVIEVSSGDGLVAGTDYTWSVVSDDKIEVVFDTAPDTDDALVVVIAAGGTSGGGGGGDAEFMGRASTTAAPGGVHDDEFDDGEIDVAWTEAKTSGSTSIFTERYGQLVFRQRDNGTAGHLHALLKPLTLSPGDYVETAVKIHRRTANDMGLGLMMSDGATHGAGNQVVAWVFTANLGRVQSWTNFTTAGSNSGDVASTAGLPTGQGPLFIRLKYEAANTWGMYVSADGFEWHAFTSSFSRTLTPTHAGLVVVRWTSGAPVLAWPRFYYFRVNPADEAD